MLISHKYRIIFVHIQRTGGNSIRQLLNGMDAAAVQELPIAAGKNRLKHCFVSDIYASIEPSVFLSYTKFAVVRNPFDRLFSWYSMFKHNTIAKSEIAGGVERTAQLGNAVEAAVAPYLDSFDSFLSLPNSGLFERFYFNQLDYLQVDGKLAVDHVLRFENLTDDFNALAKTLDLPGQLPAVNQSIRQQDYRKAYNQDAEQLVANRFSRDLDFFSYSF
ncbi:MAG: sulfotransferase family 2 domain-containing protein [Methylococcales bacterium]|nr:sulfotransferase family 2 domain-containing protein [Methylococcales bacterium]